MSFNSHFKGPTSSQKKRRGGKYRGSKTINIDEFDVDSCCFGIVESIINGHNVTVTDLKTNKLVHCSTHRNNTKKYNKGCPVVFSYIHGEKTGEILCMYNTDDLTDLCQHFKIDINKASKAIGIGIGMNTGMSVNQVEYDIPIAKTTQKTIDVVTKNPIYDLIEMDDEYEDDEIEVKYDSHGNTIEEKIIDIVVEENNKDDETKIVDIITENVDAVQLESEDEKEQLEKHTDDKHRKNKKYLKNSRTMARKNKGTFFEL
jgi:hypothetical protein